MADSRFPEKIRKIATDSYSSPGLGELAPLKQTSPPVASSNPKLPPQSDLAPCNLHNTTYKGFPAAYFLTQISVFLPDIKTIYSNSTQSLEGEANQPKQQEQQRMRNPILVEI